MKFTRLFKILFLLALAGCSWKAEEVIVFNEIDPTPVSDLNYVGINLDEDTIIVSQKTFFSLETNVTNPDLTKYKFLMIFDGDTSNFVPGFSRILIDPQDYPNGQILRYDLLGSAPSGTGSLADVFNYERVTVSKAIIFQIETYPAECEILKVENLNGFKTVSWKKFRKANFKNYVVDVTSDRQTRSYTYTDADDTVFVDSLYMIGDFRVDVTVNTVDNFSTATDTYQDEYFPAKISHNSEGYDLTIKWSTSKYYGPFQRYTLEGDNIYVQSDQHKDTTALVSNFPFGRSYPVVLNYHNDQDFTSVTGNVFVGEQMPPWDVLEYYPKSGRALYKYGVKLSTLDRPSLPSINFPYSRDQFISSDGMTVYYVEDHKVFMGNMDDGQVSQLIDFTEVLPGYRFSYVRPVISHDGNILICNIRCVPSGSSKARYALYIINARTGEIYDSTELSPFSYNDLAFSVNDDRIISRLGLTEDIIIRTIQEGVLRDTMYMPDHEGSIVYPHSTPGKMVIMDNASFTQHIADIYTGSVVSESYPIEGAEYINYLDSEDACMFVKDNKVYFVRTGEASPYLSADIFSSDGLFYMISDTLYSAAGYRIYIGQ